MNEKPRHILFLSGAGLPAWIWDDVADAFGDGYSASVAPRPSSSDGGPAEYAAAALNATTAERFTIVAHSAGGVVAAEIAARAPERVDGVLSLSAVVPEPGGSFLTALPIPQRWILPVVMRLAGTRPPESVIRKSLAEGVDAHLVDRLIEDFTPEPRSYYSGRVTTGSWRGRTGYVVTTRDKELPPALQRRFAERLDGARIEELSTGHLPMLEDPEGVAHVVESFLDADEERVESDG